MRHRAAVPLLRQPEYSSTFAGPRRDSADRLGPTSSESLVSQVVYASMTARTVDNPVPENHEWEIARIELVAAQQQSPRDQDRCGDRR